MGGFVTVARAFLVITASNGSMTYGDSVLPTITPSYSGFVNSDTAASLTTQPTCSTNATSTSPAGNGYTSTCSGAVDANYSISYNAGSVTVAAAPLTITASDGTRAYGGAAPTITAGYSAFANGESAASLTTQPTCATNTTTTSSAGNGYTSTCSGAVDDNYTFSYASGSVTVTQAALTITAGNGSMKYGDSAPPTITAGYSTFANGESAASLTTQPTCATTATSTSPVDGSYTSSCSGAVDANYAISYVSGSVNVTPAPLQITASSDSVTVGDTPAAITASYSGFVNGEGAASLTTAPTCSTTATSASGPGTYDSTCSGAADDNYAISYATGTVTVATATLTITAGNGSMTYGGSVPTITPGYSGFVNSDTAASLTTQPTCSTNATSASPAGNGYTSTCSGAAGNYSFVYVNGSVTVNQATTTTTLAANPASSSTYGQVVTLTATVSQSGDGSPDGRTVTFVDGTTTLGTSTVSGTGPFTATFPLASSFPVGPHSFTASLGGDSNVAGSNSNSSPLSFTVGLAPTTTTVVSSTSPSTTSVFGQGITLTAAVTSALTPNSGTVTFFDNGSPIATNVLVSNGQAQSPAITGLLTNSTHPYTAQYNGDGSSYAASPRSATWAQSVVPSASSTTVTGPGTSFWGQSVTLTATVAAASPGAGTPTQTVTFCDGGNGSTPCTKGGGTALTGCTSPVTVTTTLGVTTAQCVTTTLAVGQHNIVAIYSGDGNFVTSHSSTSPAFNLTISPATTGTVVTSNNNPALNGTSVTLYATVSSGAGTPTGLVNFCIGASTDSSCSGGTPLAQNVSVISGQATYTSTTLPSGYNTVTAYYLGVTNYAASGGSITQKVGATSAVLTVSQLCTTLCPTAPSPYLVQDGQTATLKATVTTGATGTVTFSFVCTATCSGTNAIGVPVSLNGQSTNTATYVGAVVFPAYGTGHILATYNGDATYNPSTGSNATALTLARETNTTSITSSSPTSVVGKPVTFTATVHPTYSLTPTGTVKFENTSFQLLSCNNSANPVPLNSAAVAQCVVTNLPYSASAQTIIAAFPGTASTQFGSSSGAVGETINKATATSTLTSDPNPGTVGQSVMLTAAITGQYPSTSPTAAGTVTFYSSGVPIPGGSGVSLLSDGTYSISSGVLAFGNYSFSVTYSGDGNYTSGSGATLPLTVNKVATTTALGNSPSTSVFGQSVTLTATVTSGSGTPTGPDTVTFYDDGSSLGSATLNSSGVATLPTTAVAQGTRTLTATYNGDSTYAVSTSLGVTQTVNAAPTAPIPPANSTGISSGFSVSTTQPITETTPDGLLSATAIGIGGLAVAEYSSDPQTQIPFLFGTGYFDVKVDPNTQFTSLAITYCNSDGTLTWWNPALNAGLGDWATVRGDPGPSYDSQTGCLTVTLDANSSPPLSQLLGTAFSEGTNTPPSTVSLVTSTSSAALGDDVTLTAAVSGDNPTGIVAFNDGQINLGSGTISNGLASITTNTIPAGPNSLTAAYEGDSSNAGSTSNPVIVTVGHGATTTELTSSPIPSIAGQAVTFTATVSETIPGVVGLGGEVDFTDGLTPLGNSSVTSGQASISVPLAGGSHTITATYSGDPNFTGSYGTLTQSVGKSGTQILLTSSINPTVSGQMTTISALVNAAGLGGGVATGQIIFSDGSTSLGTYDLTNAAKQISLSDLGVGSHTITAKYGGDTNFTGSSATLTQVVNLAASGTTVSSSVFSGPFGQNVTITASVSPEAPGAGSPSGLVTFNDGSTFLGQTAVGPDGTASISLSSLAVGSHTITATYSGDGSFNGSHATLTQTVTLAPTTTSLVNSPSASVWGQTVTLRANVAIASGAGTTSGTVTFMDGLNSIGSAPLTANQAAISVSSLSVAGHMLSAVYSGDVSFSGSTSDPVLQVVNQASTTTTITSSAATSIVGQSVTLTAAIGVVAPGAGSLSGSVTFTDGSTTLGTGAVSGGSATLTTNSLALGSHSLAASYSGDTDFAGSGSAALPETIILAATTATLNSSANPSAFGQSITLSVGVTADALLSSTPSGTVNFTDGSNPLGSATLNGGTAAITLNSLAAGSHNIVAAYSGDSTFAASGATLSQAVNKAATSVVAASSVNPSLLGQSTTLSATISVTSPGAGTPSGSVTFFDGTTSLGTGTLFGGTVSLTAASLTVGTHTIKATYSGDGSFTVSNGSLSQVVNPLPTPKASTLTLSPAIGMDVVGTTASVTATALDANGNPVSGATVVFEAVGANEASDTATTNANGQAQFSYLGLNSGNDLITAFVDSTGTGVFAVGDPQASANVWWYGTLVHGGSFVIGDKEAVVGTKVMFWGAQWSTANPMSGGGAPNSFKGFANNESTSCGPNGLTSPTFTTGTGNSASPPSSVPTYMEVLVASSAAQHGSTVSGNAVHIVVIKTDPGYAGNPGHAGTGTVVAISC